MATIAEYIWVDGTHPTALVRSKTKIMPETLEAPDLSDFPLWAFDGSSTNQAPGGDSDRILKPVCMVADPVRGKGAWLVMCEVFEPDGTTAHKSNKRAVLREVMAKAAAQEPWIAFEQEYTFFDGSKPLGFPAERRYPAPQGPYYCGVGADEVYGREVVEEHMKVCLEAGIHLTGINAEVMPGQWEFQCGGPGVDPLTASDHLWLARWLLYRVGEDYGISATLDPKPVPGDWNGAGMHTNYSTAPMRTTGGRGVIEAACEALGTRREEHLAVYGWGNEGRLTGAHETCSYKDFKYGIADRTASIRIPRMVAEVGYGYLEDRRPAANADPYDVCTVLLKTTLGLW
ncbi:MAG: glutamine synthetase beta-grasp domain-containing protein [Alphaproteobacteria bacterium]|nr:glutamine synthetase beta-grasp domain-containing protein [Alphaproteobacteria bacterium]